MANLPILTDLLGKRPPLRMTTPRPRAPPPFFHAISTQEMSLPVVNHSGGNDPHIQRSSASAIAWWDLDSYIMGYHGKSLFTYCFTGLSVWGGLWLTLILVSKDCLKLRTYLPRQSTSWQRVQYPKSTSWCCFPCPCHVLAFTIPTKANWGPNYLPTVDLQREPVEKNRSYDLAVSILP